VFNTIPNKKDSRCPQEYSECDIPLPTESEIGSAVYRICRQLRIRLCSESIEENKFFKGLAIVFPICTIIWIIIIWVIWKLFI
jgi:hypothetical protein